MRVFSTLDEIEAAVGEEIGTTDWVEITQERVDPFADATDDHQWIHVDVERAKAGPFGGTIAHGYLTLSLIPLLGSQVFDLETPGAKLNYGVNKVRFPNPVPVGSRIRATCTVAEVTDVPAGKQLTVSYVIEIEGQDKPACVAETVVLLLPGPLTGLAPPRDHSVRRSASADPVQQTGVGLVRRAVGRTSYPPSSDASARSKRSGSSVSSVSSGSPSVTGRRAGRARPRRRRPAPGPPCAPGRRRAARRPGRPPSRRAG